VFGLSLFARLNLGVSRAKGDSRSRQRLEQRLELW